MDGKPGHVRLIGHDKDLHRTDERQTQIRYLVAHALVARTRHGVAFHDAGAIVDAVILVALLDLKETRGDGLVAGFCADGFAAILDT